MKVTTVGGREVRIERICDASRDRVWRAMTEPELVAQWWGRGNRLVVERMEVLQAGMQGRLNENHAAQFSPWLFESLSR